MKPIIVRLASAGLVVVVLFSAAEVNPQQDRTEVFSYDAAGRDVPAAMLEGSELYDADLGAVEGDLWMTGLEFVPGQGDHLWISRRNGESWGPRERLTARPGAYQRPTLTPDGDGGLWLSYETRDEEAGRWDVWVRRVTGDGRAGKVFRASPGAGNDINHCAVGDARGGVWLTWQTDVDGQFDVVACRVGVDGKASPPERVGNSPRGDWHPAIAVSGSGDVCVVWDGFDGNSFNVFSRCRRDGKWGPVRSLAATPAFEGRADVACDRRNRFWVAWEEGGLNWGKPFVGISTTKVNDRNGSLHRFRLLRCGVLDADGSVRLLEDGLPMPSVVRARQREGAREDLRHSGAFYERVRLTVDEAGRPWVAYRHYYIPWLGIKHHSHVEKGWGVYARFYGKAGWSKLFRAGIGQGDGLQRLELASSGEGVAAVWTTGRTHRSPSKRPRGIVFARLIGAGAAPEKLSVAAAPSRDRGRTTAPAGRPEPATIGGATFQLLFGDLHRHTDLSLCRVPTDGTIDDAYRYAIEVARLDFLGITDHSRDVAKGNALSQLWWRSTKQVTRHRLGTAFFPLFAYERSHGNTADHNVISLRPDMLRAHTYPVPEFWKELDRDTITIPHQPVRRDTWKYQDDALRPLVEIYQGCRDKSIEPDAHRGLAKGYHLGFIASSDHQSTSASYACVWTPEAGEEAIFRSLQARRTFGATAKIRLIFRSGNRWMGERFESEGVPTFQLEIDGTAPIKSIRMIQDGRPVATLPVEREARNARAEWRPDRDLDGRHYFYVHLIQRDGNQAWSSPIWVQIGKSP